MNVFGTADAILQILVNSSQKMNPFAIREPYQPRKDTSRTPKPTVPLAIICGEEASVGPGGGHIRSFGCVRKVGNPPENGA